MFYLRQIMHVVKNRFRDFMAQPLLFPSIFFKIRIPFITPKIWNKCISKIYFYFLPYIFGPFLPIENCSFWSICEVLIIHNGFFPIYKVNGISVWQIFAQMFWISYWVQKWQNAILQNLHFFTNSNFKNGCLDCESPMKKYSIVLFAFINSIINV